MRREATDPGISTVDSDTIKSALMPAAAVKGTVMDEAALRAGYTWAIVALCVPSAAANLCVLLSSGLLLGDAEPRAAYKLLGSIALADLANSCVVFAGLVYPHSGRTAEQCALLIGGEVSFSLLSMMSIVLIAAERYFYIVHGIQYGNILTPKRIRLLILICWLVALGFGLVPELVYMMQVTDASFHCRFVNGNPKVIILASSVAIPTLLITIAIYSVLFFHVRRIIGAGTGTRGAAEMKLKSIFVVFLSSICFLVTWGPYMVTGFSYAVICQPYSVSSTCKYMALALSSPLAVMGFLNSVLNPLIYAWWHRPFNLAIRKIICPKKMRQKRRDNIQNTSIETISEKNTL